MKKIWVVLLMITLTMTSCFEIIEEIVLNDDGSGKVSMTVNISRSKTKLKSIMLMDSINNYKVPSVSDIRTNMAKMVAEIEKIDGVSKVSHNLDFEDFIFTVSCDFRDVDVLNNVITHFSTDGEKQALQKNKQFSYDASRKVFVRNYHYNLADEIHRLKQQDQEVLDEASITTLYRFNSLVESSTNTHARVAGNKKAVMLKIGARDMISNKKNIKNTITLQ